MLVIVLFLLIMQAYAPELSRTTIKQALRSRDLSSLKSHDSNVMETEAKYLGKSETGTLTCISGK